MFHTKIRKFKGNVICVYMAVWFEKLWLFFYKNLFEIVSRNLFCKTEPHWSILTQLTNPIQIPTHLLSFKFGSKNWKFEISIFLSLRINIFFMIFFLSLMRRFMAQIKIDIQKYLCRYQNSKIQMSISILKFYQVDFNVGGYSGDGRLWGWKEEMVRN